MNNKVKKPKPQKPKAKINHNRPIIEEDSESDSSSAKDKESSVSKSQDSFRTSIRLSKMIIDNFKSFEGRHEIGYFLNFSVVMGPNGSGKSNIIDALCFALGMNLHSLRTKNYKDLIYKPTNDIAHTQKKTCFVELIFTEQLTENEVSFRRSIQSNGANNYYFNGARVNVSDYVRELQERSSPAHAMYFVLAQGAIDSLLSKKNDLRQTIELLSGSFELKQTYDSLLQQIQERNKEISKLSAMVNTIKDDKNKLKNQIENEEAYTKVLEDVNAIITEIYLYRLAEQDSIIAKCTENYESNAEEMQKVQNEKTNIVNEMRANDSQVKTKESEMKEAFERSSEVKSEFELVKSKARALEEKVKSLEMALFTGVSTLNQLQEEQKKKAAKKSALVQGQKSIMQEIDKIKSILNNDELLVESSDITKTQIKEYKALQITLQSKTAKDFKEIESLNLLINESLTKKNITERSLALFDNEKTKILNEIDAVTNKAFTENSEVEKLTAENKKLRTTYSKASDKLAKLDKEYASLYAELEAKLNEKSQIEINFQENAKKRQISEFMNKNEKVFGFLYELITPLQKKLELPIKVSLLKYLNYLVVEDSATALAVSEFLKGKDISCDVLVLENVPRSDNYEAIRLKLGGLGNLVIDLIDCKKKGLKNAINYFLKNMVFCSDASNIEHLRKEGFYTIITMDGTIYKKSSIVGGHYKNLQQYSFNYSSYPNASVHETSKRITQDIEQITARIKEIEKEKEEMLFDNTLKNKIIQNENDISFKKKNVELRKEESQKLAERLKEIEINIKTNQDLLNELDAQLDEANDKIAQTNSAIAKVKDELYSPFLKKYKLKSLQAFDKFSLSEMQKLSDNLKLKEEKYLILQSQLTSLKNLDTKIDETKKEIQSIKNQKSEVEDEKREVDKSMKALSTKITDYQSAISTAQSEINNIKDNRKKYNEDIEQKDKRLRNLIKNKIETDHKLQTAHEQLNNIIFETKTDPDKLLKDLGDIYSNSSVILSFDINIERFVKKQGTSLVIDYNLIDVEDKSTEEIQDVISEKKDELCLKFKEIEKYVKTISLGEEENQTIKDKQTKLSKEKQEIKNKIKNLIIEQDKSKEDLLKIKKERKNKFSHFFAKLQRILVEEYKHMTSSENNPGGTAYIYNTNEDEPYNGNICYLPTPPGKKVIYDIEQLSGGEKTIAILSLLVSLQKIAGTPFLILDEVDAYLDPEHEIILEKLFKAITKENQVIIVTHKSSIFKSAQSLIGTYFNQSKYTSVPVSIQLAS